MKENMMPVVAWLVFVAAAVLEVGGDASVRKGLRGGGWLPIAAGCLMLAGYGLVVNLVKWDFSRLLGVYVAVFAVVSVLFGRFLFKRLCRPPPGLVWESLSSVGPSSNSGLVD